MLPVTYPTAAKAQLQPNITGRDTGRSLLCHPDGHRQKPTGGVAATAPSHRAGAAGRGKTRGLCAPAVLWRGRQPAARGQAAARCRKDALAFCAQNPSRRVKYL